MESWVEFALGRYNYWIVIILMMTGLYIVFARGNLVKKIVGLNLFQTSVFIFYITIGKITGGTAPIYWKKDVYAGGGHGDAHADAGHTNEAGGDHGEAAGHDVSDNITDHGEAASSLHDKVENSLPTNDLKAALEKVGADHDSATTSLHAAPDAANKIANDGLAVTDDKLGSTFAIDKDALEAMHSSGGDAAVAGAHGGWARCRYRASICLFKPVAACFDSDGDCCRRCNHGGRVGARGAYP